MEHEMARALSGHEREASAVGRPSRLEVDRLADRQRVRLAGGEIEVHELDGAAIVADEGDASAVR